MPSNAAKPELSLGEKAVEAGLRLYDKFADRKSMPVNRRVFLESVLDRSTDPITEAALSPVELNTLGEIIRNKYKPLDPALKQYEAFLLHKLDIHNRAVANKDRDRVLYPEFYDRYTQDLAALQNYRQGKITPTFIDITSGTPEQRRDATLFKIGLRDVFNVKPVVTYEDYGIPAAEARHALAGDDPRAALHTTLGRFRYEADPATGALVVVDKYNFNAPIATLTGRAQTTPAIGVEQLATSPEGLEGGVYGLLRQYAGRVLPEGTGRNVRIRLNKLAPPAANQLVD